MKRRIIYLNNSDYRGSYMSWEEFKKKKEKSSSWQQFKTKKENKKQNNPKKQETSLWQNIQNIASGVGKGTENLWLGLENGLKSFQQTMQRNTAKVQADTADTHNEIFQKLTKNKMNNSSQEDKEKIQKAIDNPLISGDEIRQESREYYEKVQEQKNKNITKMQKNAESIENPVGKYLVGEIAPSIGQMLPGMVGGPVGIAYFTGSAAGNYYEKLAS